MLLAPTSHPVPSTAIDGKASLFLDPSCISKERSEFGLRGQQDGGFAEVMLLDTFMKAAG